MKIAYIARWDASRESGVLKKIRTQLNCWKALGADARLFLLSPTTERWGGLEDLAVDIVESRSLRERGRTLRELLRKVERWSPDLGYLRFGTHYRALERFMENVPTVLELNTSDIGEYRLYLPPYKYWYHRATRGRILSRARGMVSVTGEIGQVFQTRGVPQAVIANGIDLEGTPAAPVRRGNGPCRAIFVGSPELSWHGVDKILDLADRIPEWKFDLVGPSSMTSAPPNITAHGVLAEPDYRSLLEQADLALGTLALHRNGMREACPLKVREYLAAGLPCVIGYADTDFYTPTSYMLELPNTPDNVMESVDAIRAFGERWRGRRVDRASVRHIDIQIKERRRLEFFCHCLAAAPKT